MASREFPTLTGSQWASADLEIVADLSRQVDRYAVRTVGGPCMRWPVRDVKQSDTPLCHTLSAFCAVRVCANNELRWSQRHRVLLRRPRIVVYSGRQHFILIHSPTELIGMKFSPIWQRSSSKNFIQWSAGWLSASLDKSFELERCQSGEEC